MRIEHLALNVNNPAELTEWLCDNLDMRILRQFGNPPNAFFVADSEEHTVLGSTRTRTAPFRITRP